jgi:hypothetical protein
MQNGKKIVNVLAVPFSPADPKIEDTNKMSKSQQLIGTKYNHVILTINVPLFKKLRDIIFFCGTITL